MSLVQNQRLGFHLNEESVLGTLLFKTYYAEQPVPITMTPFRIYHGCDDESSNTFSSFQD